MQVWLVFQISDGKPVAIFRRVKRVCGSVGYACRVGTQ
jgi:hypothetical protein